MAGGINPFVYANSNPLIFIDPDGQFFILGAGIGAGVGGLIGAGTAFFTGGDILAGAAGGAVAGAVVGSGAGLVAAAGSAFGASGAVLTGAAFGAAGGVSGNVTSQVLGHRRNGQSWSQAYSNIDKTQLAISTIVGSAFGAAGGGLTSGTHAFQASSQAVQRTMTNNINTISKALYDMGASASTVHAVQNSITQGVWGSSINTANILGIISAMQAAGLPITESAILSYINDQVRGCP